MITYLVRPERLSALAEIVKGWKAVVFDVETTGLSPYLGDKVLGFGICELSPEPGEAYYIPAQHDHPEDNQAWNCSVDSLWVLWRAIGDKPIVGYNLKFDLHASKENLGVLWSRNVLYDLLPLARILSTEDRPVLDLETMAGRELDYEYPCRIAKERKLKDGAVESYYVMPMAHKLRRDGTREFTAQQIGNKCCEDVYLTSRLYYHWKAKLEEAPKLRDLYRREVGLTRSLFQMESRGIGFDSWAYEETHSLVRERSDGILSRIRHQTNIPEFNPRSSPQVVALMSTLKLKSSKKSGKTGVDSWDRDCLLEVMDKHPIALALAQYRALEHEQSNLLAELEEYVKRDLTAMHYTYQNWGTVTGRLSAKEPNVQGIAKGWLQMGRSGEEGQALYWSEEGPDFSLSLRKMFVPRPGYVFLEADYRQIEMFVAGFYFQDAAFMALLEAEDFHGATARWVWGSDAPEYRRRAKYFNFGLLYGMGLLALAKQIECTKSEAEAYKSQYMKKIGPGYYKVMNAVRWHLQNRGYIENIYGRRYYLDVERAYMGFNYIVQGGAADFVKFRQAAIKPICQELDIHPIFTTHDDILFEAPVEVLGSHHLQQLIRILEDGKPFGMRLPVKVRIGYENWAEMEELKIGTPIGS